MGQEKLAFFTLNIIVLLLLFHGVRMVRSTLIRGHNHPSYNLGLILGSGIAGIWHRICRDERNLLPQ